MNTGFKLVKDGEIEQFAQAVQAYQDGTLDGEKFMGLRLQHGVYGQRQDGVHMVRIKVPGGRLDPAQLDAVADVLEHYSRDDKACITTRQDIQLHFVPLANVVATMQRLAETGLTTREACGNTVRNVTACPLAGVCPREHVDITPHLEATVQHLLRHTLTQHMPRKFKISFSGCESDCAQGLLHDLGVVAVRRNNEYGFKVLAGGGLGHKPREAIVIEEFLPERHLLPCIEAVIALHHRYSDRKLRAKSRIKFLVDRFGKEGFIEKYREEFARAREAFADRPYAKGAWTGGSEGEVCGTGAPRALFAQKQPGLYVFPIGVHLGDITAAQLRGVAATMRRHGLADVRTTQDQNLMLLNVPEAAVTALRTELRTVGLGEPQRGDDVVSCPGTWTCRLGITSSRDMAAQLSGGAQDLRIRVSGCPNSCAQPQTGDIGLNGEGRRVHGKLVPHYQMHFGGSGLNGHHFGFEGPSVPTARAGQAIERVRAAYAEQKSEGESFYTWSRRVGADYFEELLADISRVAETELASVLKDHGQTEAFRVLQLGGGECAGASQEFVGANLAEAIHEHGYRDTFVRQRMYAEAVDCSEAILRQVGKCLLYVAGLKQSADLAEITARLRETDRFAADLVERLAAQAAEVAALRAEFDLDRFQALATAQDAWMAEARQVCETPAQPAVLGVTLNLRPPAVKVG